jgi:hypothetical protein
MATYQHMRYRILYSIEVSRTAAALHTTSQMSDDELHVFPGYLITIV